MNEKDNPILRKSYSFSLQIIKCYKQLNQEHRCYELSRQLLRSGTSIGANIEEAQGGQSKRDFIAKMYIAFKEAKETHYWLRLLRDSSLLENRAAAGLIGNCEELLKLLTSILKSSQSK